MGIGGVTPEQILQVARQSLQSERDKIDARRKDATAIEDKKLAFTNVDKALEEMRTTLFNFTKTSLFQQRTVTSSDSDVVSASASSTAPATSYSFSSITQLAQAAKVTSSATLGFANGTSPYRLSTADVNGGTDYDPNQAITVNQSLGSAITAGTFVINGVNITVSNTDTVNTILTKINNSGANVNAVFDVLTDKVRLSGTQVGADEPLTVSDGDTNFFTALNLNSLSSGTDNEWEEALDDGPLSAVTSGYFNINNFTFSVDPATESLDDIISKVNKSNAGVTMFYDDVSDKVTIQNKTEGVKLQLGNDTSGFLNAVKVFNIAGDADATTEYSEYNFTQASFTLNGQALTRDTNTFAINGVTFSLLNTSATPVSVTVNQNLDKTVNTVKDFAARFNATLSRVNDEITKEDGPLKRNATLREMRVQLLNDVLQTIDNPGAFTSLVDIGFEVVSSGGGEFTLNFNEETFRSKLQTDEASVQQLFAYDNDGDGLLDEGGYAVATRDYLSGFTRAVSGVFDQLTDDLDTRLSTVNQDVERMEDRLLKLEERRFLEFAEQVVTLQRLQQQQARVSQASQQLLQSVLG